METVKSVRRSIMTNNWAVSIDLTDAYLHVPIHPRSRKYLRFVYEHQVFQFMALPFGMSLSPWICTKLMNVIATHLPLHAVSLFPYLDDWLIRDLIHNRFISNTKYTFQMVKNLNFIPNLKKSDLIPTKEFTFIGMEFLTQQKIVRVPANRVKALILTIKTILFSSWAFFNKVLLNEILKAAVWNQSSTFSKFYLRDMSQQLQNLHNLGPIVVAQKVVPN